VNGNVEFFGVLVERLVADLPDSTAAKQVHCHPLDGANVDEGMRWLGG
jgi:hypothetical protein